MKRALTAMLVGALLLIPTVQAHAISKKYCMFQTLDRETNSHRENDRVAKCMAWHAGVDNSTLQYVMDRESGGNEFAVNSYSGALGLFQHLPQYWPLRVAACDATLDRFQVKDRAWYNPRANTAVTICMVKRGGWSPWGF